MKSKDSIVKDISSDNKKERKTWSETKRANGYTKEITVEELDNKGYIVTVYLSGNDKKGMYVSSTKKFYSEINPLDQDKTDDPISIFYAALKNNR